MSTINPLLSTFSPAPATRSGGASASSGPATAAVSAIAAARPLEGATSPMAQGLQAPGIGARADNERPPQDRAALQQELDAVLQDVQTSLRFRVDDDVNRVVVSVVDQGSGDVIYQIPSEVALQIAKRMAELGSGMINESA